MATNNRRVLTPRWAFVETGFLCIYGGFITWILLGLDGIKLIKRFGILTLLGFLSDCDIPQKDGDLAELHSQVKDNVIGIHSRNHHQLVLSFEFGQVPKGFKDGSFKPRLGMSGEWQPYGDAAPLGFDQNGGELSLSSSTGFVKVGHVRVPDYAGQCPDCLVADVLVVQLSNGGVV